MPIPELVRRTAEKLLTDFCRRSLPFCGRGEGQLSFTFEEDGIVLFEEQCACRKEGQGPRPVARFRFDCDLSQWTLHYPGPDRRWLFYLNAGPSLHLGKLLHHLERDPLGLFWS